MDASFVSRARVLILALLVAFLIACSQGSTPTLVPTIALLPAQAPTPLPVEPSPLPEPTSAPTPWPTADETSAPEATSMPTVEPAACDADMLGTYAGVVGRLQAVYKLLKEQGFGQEAMLAAIPHMEGLEEQAQGLPVPCEGALGLRQALVDHIGADIQNLVDFTTGAATGDPQLEIRVDPGIEQALKTLWEDIEGGAEAGQATTVPALACDCSGDFYDCAYFRSQGEAQGCFDYCLPRTGDVHALDEDGDGVVCASLP